MNLSVDTNVLVRGVVRDDLAQADVADRTLRDATTIVVALPCLCEFVWVLRRVYRFAVGDIVAAIDALIASANVTVNRPAVEEGLAVLRAGGDFADGVIAHEGRWSGAEVFVSFDRKATTLLDAQGYATKLLR